MSANINTERLSKCYSSVIHDIMRDDGYKNLHDYRYENNILNEIYF